MRRTFLIATNTLKEASRQKLMLLLALIALVLVASSNYFLKLDIGHDRLKFVFDFTSGALGFFGSIIAIIATCQIVHSELENRTATTLLSKPVGRLGFVCGKAFGVFAALAIFTAVVAVAGTSMLAYTYISFGESAQKLSQGLTINYFGVSVFCFVQWLRLCTIASITTLVCTLSSSLLFSAVISFAIMAIGMIGSAIEFFGAKENFASQIASVLFPNLQVFSVAETFAFEEVSLKIFAMCSAYAVIYIAVCLCLSAFAFSKREF